MDTVPTLWADWLRVLAGHGFDPRPDPPAGAAALDAAEAATGLALPADVRALYAVADGQAGHPASPAFPMYRFLPVADAVAEWRNWRDVAASSGPDGMADFADGITVRAGDHVRREYWTPGWWPLAMDGGGNLLVADTTPPPGGTVGQIVVMGPDEDERRVLAPGLAGYLRALLTAPVEIVDPGSDGPVWDVPDLR